MFKITVLCGLAARGRGSDWFANGLLTTGVDNPGCCWIRQPPTSPASRPVRQLRTGLESWNLLRVRRLGVESLRARQVRGPLPDRKGSFCCFWGPRWEPRAHVSRRTEPGPSTQPPPACHLRAGARTRAKPRYPEGGRWREGRVARTRQRRSDEHQGDEDLENSAHPGLPPRTPLRMAPVARCFTPDHPARTRQVFPVHSGLAATARAAGRDQAPLACH
jgi:hypothetical protein